MNALNEQDFLRKVRGFDWNGVALPTGMHQGLLRYVIYGIRPGAFLTAVITNNLRLAFECADEHNGHAMAAWVAFFYNHCPSGCWGSAEKMKSWIDLARQSR